jgi:hypothetical protein
MRRPVLLACLAIAALAALGAGYFWRFEIREALPMPLWWRDARTVDWSLRKVALGEPSAAQPDERPDILLVVLDTVRQDRVSLYGYAEDTMPALASWAERARVFREARSASS